MPFDSKALILAGPGTGKTHTLMHRLVNLVQDQGIMPSSEMLILSFSRAAAAEIRNRVSLYKGIHDDLRFLNVRTFDSFATLLLLTLDENIDLSSLDYDERIALAVTKLSDEYSTASDILMQFQHVLVDEIQDLVGVRAQLVMKILERTEGGFTVLGDPAQGIYDYLVDQTRIGPSSTDFLKWLRENWKDELLEFSLDHNFRVVSGSANVAGKARTLVLGEENDENAYLVLRDIVDSLPEAGSIEKPCLSDIVSNEKKAALLCRTNSDVLFVSDCMRKSGISSVISPHVDERSIPSWIGRVFSGEESRQVSYMDFEKKWVKLIDRDKFTDWKYAWNVLKRVEGSDRENLDLSRLRSCLRNGADWALNSVVGEGDDNLVVTTIHQSKGREYDEVIILPASERIQNLSNGNECEEAKVLYVAATRAKNRIYRIDRQGIPVSQPNFFPGGRERITGQNRDGKHLLEVQPGDIEHSSFVSISLFSGQDPARKVQELIWHVLKPGTPLILVTQDSPSGLKIYLAWNNPKSGNPVPLAVMTEEFFKDLVYYKNQLPNARNVSVSTRMEGCYVIDRRTIILPPYPENIHEPWTSTGFCLGIGIKGLIVVD